MTARTDGTSGHVVGVDAGATSTRALAVDHAGRRLGAGRSGGANPNAHPPAEAAEHVAEAVDAALEGLDRGETRACVVGMAGLSKLSDPAVAAVFEAAWEGIGLAGRVRTVTDAEVAFASATSSSDGTVLVAGTGSVAGRIRDGRLVATFGGYGWLLGDEGSAFWLGREAVRSTLEALCRGRELGGLPAAVLREALSVSSVDSLTESDRMATARELITRANAEPPIRLARYAPLVSEAHSAGDPAARDITRRAADLLVADAMAARVPGEDTPVVLVGSVLQKTSPVGELVRERLGGNAVQKVLTSGDGVSGAVWLAALDAFGGTAVRPFSD